MQPPSTRSQRPFGVVIASALLVLLGACVLTGWTIGEAALVRVFPGTTAMALNTAAMFLAVGLGLAASCVAARWARSARALLGGVLVLWPLLILTQHVTGADLGIDWAAVHQRLGDGHAKPGRMAPNACIGFMLAGLLLIVARNGPPGAGGMRAARWLAGAVLVIGLSAFVGYLLQLELLYRVASYNQMAALTALGMTCAGSGLMALVVGWRDVQPQRVPDAGQVTWLAAGLLSLFALGTGLVAFGLLKDSYERSAAANLAHTAAKSGAGVTALLDKTLLLSNAVASRPALTRAMARMGGDPADLVAAEQLRGEEQTFLALGFSGVRFLRSDGQPVGAAGGLSVAPAVAAPLDQPGMRAWLLWDREFMLRSEHEILERGVSLGKVVLERPMPELTAFVRSAQQTARTGDFRLCFRTGDRVACFPSRFYPEATSYPMFNSAGEPVLPIARALLGQQGVQSLKDPRGVAVIAAYAPVGRYPLALVEKLDTQELYVPLRNAMPLLVGMTLLLVLAGSLMLRRWVRPIVQKIEGERARAAAVLDNSIDAFVALDEQGRLAQWNEQAERLLGWTRAEALGRDARELLGLPQDVLSASAGETHGTRLQAQVRDKSGAELPVELSVAAVEGQEGLATSIFVRDLRESRERERQLAQTREALVQAQKLEAIGKLTGGVAHDFNNVLQVIGSNLQLIQVQAGAGAGPLVSAALGAVERGAKLSSQLLAFARRQPLQPVPFDVNRRITRMDDLLRRSLGERIEIETVLAAGLWTTMADPSQLENVVLNLAINARDAMPGGGRLTIETANCTLDDAYACEFNDLRPGQYVMVAVSDTGSGMTPEVLARVFEPFYTTKPEGQGTGLGLSMAYGFAKQSGGHIRIYSEPGSGTTVKLYLPRSLEAEVAVPSTLSSAVVGGSETILVVEDDPAVQASVVRMLQALGYHTLRANDAQAALTVLQSGVHVDLLFTDVVMPGPLRSPELAQLARGLHPDIRVLFTSGYTQNSIVHGGRLDPGIELLSKPYRQEDLARKVRRLLDERRPEASPADAPSAAQAEAEEGEAPAAAAGLEAVPGSLQTRVLLVEDQQDLRETTQQLLQMLGAYTVSAASAEDAQRLLERESFHLLLTDVTLPGQDGVALAQAARRLQPNLHIAFATGHGGTMEFPEGLAQSVLTKPYSMEELQQLLVRAQSAQPVG